MRTLQVWKMMPMNLETAQCLVEDIYHDYKKHRIVYNHWTGLVEWIGGLTLKFIFMVSNKIH